MEIIRHNMKVVGHPHVTVEQAKVSDYVPRAPKEHFSMVLADPPYDLPDEDVAEMLNALVPLLTHDAAVVVERHRESPETDWPDGFTPTGQKLKKRLYGIARMDMATFSRAERDEKA